MQCAECNHVNADDMSFCTQCGTLLPRVCSACRFASPAGAKFCGRCGTAFAAGPKEEKTAEPATQRIAAPAEVLSPSRERRHLSVMFCDLCDSVALAASLDPEDLLTVINGYHEACATVIRRYEGYIAQYLGDGILVYFSFPAAHEDDPQRAVRTGLAILAQLQQLSARLNREVPALAGRRLEARVGIHTGYVVVGELGRIDKAGPIALGEAPNIAARLQALAAPGTLLVSKATWKLIDGYFAGRLLGVKALKGIGTAQEIYQVLSESEAMSRFEISVTAGLTPMVARDEQVELLLKSWTYASDGMGQVVLLRGEPGIGKSRLVQALKDRVAATGVVKIDCSCSSYFQNTAFYPIIELLQRAFRFSRDDSLADKLTKMQTVLKPLQQEIPQLLPLMAVLLTLRTPAEDPDTLGLSSLALKERTISAMLAWLLSRSAERALLVVFEDLQWADASTLELLTRLVDQVPTVRILLIVTFRSEFIPPWAPRAHIVPLAVNRLAPSNAAALVRKICRGKALPVEVLEQIVRKTDGVPLFIEELTKMVLGSGWLRDTGTSYQLVGPLPPLAIPTTLQDSLMARLDRLDSVKDVAQVGAAIGREFSYELLQAVTRLDDAVLSNALAKLVEAEVLYPHGVETKVYYRFKHVLIQDAAYQSLLRVKRQRYHEEIVRVLETQFSELCESQPEILAYHCTEAGLLERAVPYWQQAGERAIGRSAEHEGIAHLEKGLRLLQSLPVGSARSKRELAMWLTLGIGYMATKGVAADEVGEAFAKAHTLAQQEQDRHELVRVLRGMARYYLVRGDCEMSLQCGEQLLSLVRDSGDKALLLGAHYVVGCALFFSARFREAEQHISAGLVLHEGSSLRQASALYEPFDTGVACYAFGAHVLWYLGYADQALQRSHRSLELAKQLGQPYSLTAAQTLAGLLYVMRGEYRDALDLISQQLPASDERGFSLYIALGTMLRGWASAKLGAVENGVADIRQGLIAYRATGAGMTLSMALGVLADDLGHRGFTAEALTLIREAFETVESTKERLFESELYRIKGELLQKGKSGRPKEILEMLRNAVRLADERAAKALQLRAAMSLGRYLEHQGNTAEAAAQLRVVREWFTEGLDTEDLRAADELLARWAS